MEWEYRNRDKASTKSIVLVAAVVVLVTAGFLPVLAMLFRSFVTDGRVSFLYFERLFAASRPWVLLSRSLAISGLTTLTALAVGLPLAILLSRTDLPLRRVLTFLFAIPLVVPPYLVAVLWFHILGRQGLAASFLGPAFTETSSRWLFALPGCILVLFTVLLPIVVLLVMVLLKTVNPRLEEAGRMTAGWPAVLRRITIPLILHGVLLAAIVVFLLSFGEFGVPMFLRYEVFPVEAFTQFAAFRDFGAGAMASLPLILVTLLLLAVEKSFLRNRTYSLRPLPGAHSHPTIPLGAARWPAFALVGTLGALLVLIPFSAMIGEALSGRIFRDALARAGDSLIRSLFYAASGATILTVVGFFLGYLIQRRALRLWQHVDSLSVFLFALPSTVIGIGLVTVWNHPATGFIYSTPAILMLGYLAQYSALSSRVSVSALAQVPAAMEEAAQVVGAGWLRRVTFIVVPLCLRGIVGTWVVAYIFCLRDTGISMMVYPPGRDTLPVRILTLMANGSTELIATLCLIMTAAVMAPLALGAALLYFRKRTGNL
jgi:iron(III) transport system permease protein